MAVMGTFAFEEDFIAAAKNLKSSGFDNISLLSPLPLEEAQEVLGLGKSPVRRFSLAGAIIGAASGFAMAVATALVFILVLRYPGERLAAVFLVNPKQTPVDACAVVALDEQIVDVFDFANLNRRRV